MDHDDTPSEWSFHSSLYHRQPQQQQHQATATLLSMSVSSSPVVSRTRKASPPSEAAGTSPSYSILGSKRARLDADEDVEKRSACNLFLPGGMKSGSDRGSCALNHGKAGEAARSADVDGGGGSCCSFRWSQGEDYQRDNQRNQRDNQQWSGIRGQSAEGRKQQHQHDHGGSDAVGLGGGMSATAPNGMDVVVGGDRREARPISECVLNGGVEAQIGIGSGSGKGQPGGGAVISSGFGAGGFPKHQWHQDQGGSSDDMLILYGSPS